MKKGIINCDCGKEFYYATVRDEVICIGCQKVHEAVTQMMEDKEDGQDSEENEIQTIHTKEYIDEMLIY